MSDVILEMSHPYIVQELICIGCKKRSVNVRSNDGTWLKDLYCPYCEKKGFMIATGQELDDEQEKKND